MQLWTECGLCAKVLGSHFDRNLKVQCPTQYRVLSIYPLLEKNSQHDIFMPLLSFTFRECLQNIKSDNVIGLFVRRSV